MKHVLRHLRSNLVSYLALFVALGGTSYAAFRLPTDSVGTRQLRNSAVTSKKLANGSITPSKLSTQISGTVRLWARLSASGTVVASNPRAHVVGWSAVFHSGRVSWGRAIPSGCFSLATVDGLMSEGFASVATVSRSNPSAVVVVSDFNATGQPAAEPVNVAVICP
jgi:hypothetical protein